MAAAPSKPDAVALSPLRSREEYTIIFARASSRPWWWQCLLWNYKVLKTKVRSKSGSMRAAKGLD